MRENLMSGSERGIVNPSHQQTMVIR